jgi:(4-O-methyl)-D-glucuronate---lignin esterase
MWPFPQPHCDNDQVMKMTRVQIFLPLALILLVVAQTSPAQVSRAEMEAVYREVRTPYKYGIVLPAPPDKKVDCPNVFRYEGKWYMIYVQLENDPAGYVTRLAESDDLLEWRPLRTVLERGPAGAWDAAQAAGGLALHQTAWGANGLEKYEGRYWISYLGGPNPGYETAPLSIGIASAADPVRGPWQRPGRPALSADDADARPTERTRLYKSFVFRDTTRTLGAPFVMLYNAHTHGDSERIFAAVSEDMRAWRRYGSAHVLGNEPPAGVRTVISGDPQVVRMKRLWVMFYFGAFWKPGAFDTFAASRDLVHWTKWDGPDLIAASESWDAQFAHKPWILKYRGVVYHFYCAVDKEGNRAIALATSKDLRKR